MKKNKSKKKNLYTIIALFIAIITVSSCVFIVSTKKDTEFTYNQFVQQMENGKVKEVYYSQEKDYFNGILKDGTTFEVQNPQTDDFKLILLENDISVHESATINVEAFVTLFSMVAMMIFFYLVVGKRFLKANGGIDGKSNFSLITKIPNVKMKDVAGNDEAKESLMEIIDFLKNPIEFKKYGAKAPKGVLLEGVPGVGKTLLGKAVAGEAGVNFISVSGADFAYKWVGEGPDRVKELFRKARANSPCIIFIDEIDAIGKKRGDADSSNQERDNTLNQLLVEMDGFSSDDNIIVIGATNRKDILDSAFRSGRFDRQIQVVPPDLEARIAIIKVHSEGKPLNEDVDFDILGQMTIGMTGADLENMMNTASINAAKAKRENGITMEDISKAFDTIMVGDERKNKNSIKIEDRSITAYHEAGHCLIAKILGQKVSKVTINPTTKGIGGYTMIPPTEMHYETKKDMYNHIKMLLGGRAAEEIIFGKDNVTSGAANDLLVMSRIIKKMLREDGMGETFGLINANILPDNSTMDEKFLLEMKEISNGIYKETIDIIDNNIDKLKTLAELLLKKETIMEKDIDNILYQ